MNVKCFACDVVIERADAEACADAFVAHGRGWQGGREHRSAREARVCLQTQASDARERGAQRPTRSSVVQARQPFTAGTIQSGAPKGIRTPDLHLERVAS